MRVKDIDFQRRQVTVREGKGGKDRVTMLPRAIIDRLERHLACVRTMHERDLEAGHGRAPLPSALATLLQLAPTHASLNDQVPIGALKLPLNNVVGLFS